MMFVELPPLVERALREPNIHVLQYLADRTDVGFPAGVEVIHKKLKIGSTTASSAIQSLIVCGAVESHENPMSDSYGSGSGVYGYVVTDLGYELLGRKRKW